MQYRVCVVGAAQIDLGAAGRAGGGEVALWQRSDTRVCSDPAAMDADAEIWGGGWIDGEQQEVDGGQGGVEQPVPYPKLAMGAVRWSG